MVSSRRLRRPRCIAAVDAMPVALAGTSAPHIRRLDPLFRMGHRYHSHVTKTSSPSSAISIFTLLFEYIIYKICTRIRKDSSLARVELLWRSSEKSCEKANTKPQRSQGRTRECSGRRQGKWFLSFSLGYNISPTLLVRILFGRILFCPLARPAFSSSAGSILGQRPAAAHA